ncbi:MAG: HAMP domain-containing histidine kinase [Candidatus Thiodiazotropha sp. (ex Troendleina suluensis)]|nr:HAMP domain-containing histidine kinase [Candidatus Thiodiazotropha sp. (ex Troendleina suluensis)]
MASRVSVVGVLALTGISAGAISSYASLFSVYALFTIPATLPLAIRLLLEMDGTHIVMGLLVTLFTSVTMVIAYRYNQSMTTTIPFGEEKQWLANEEMPLAIAQTLDGVKNVTQIVHSMKEFSHSSSNHREVVGINHAIESTIVVSRNEWKYDVDMITDFDEALTAVPCYPGEFNQMILNMIVNAIKDAKGDGEQQVVITVSTSVAAEYAEIRIKDTGTGMAKEARKHIFESFLQPRRWVRARARVWPSPMPFGRKTWWDD